MVDDGLSHAAFFALPLAARADRVWDALFVRRTPVSEARVGVLRTLAELGAPGAAMRAARAGDLGPLRAWYAARAPGDHVDAVFRAANVRYVRSPCGNPVARLASAGRRRRHAGRLHERALRRARGEPLRRRGLLRGPGDGALPGLAPRRRRRGDGRRPLPHRAARRRAPRGRLGHGRRGAPRARARRDARRGAALPDGVGAALRRGVPHGLDARRPAVRGRRRGPRARLAVGDAARRRGPGARRARPGPPARAQARVRAAAGAGPRAVRRRRRPAARRPPPARAAAHGAAAAQGPGDAARARGPARGLRPGPEVPQPAPVRLLVVLQQPVHHPRAHEHAAGDARDGLHRAALGLPRARPARLQVAPLARRHRGGARGPVRAPPRRRLDPDAGRRAARRARPAGRRLRGLPREDAALRRGAAAAPAPRFNVCSCLG